MNAEVTETVVLEEWEHMFIKELDDGAFESRTNFTYTQGLILEEFILLRYLSMAKRTNISRNWNLISYLSGLFFVLY